MVLILSVYFLLFILMSFFAANVECSPVDGKVIYLVKRAYVAEGDDEVYALKPISDKGYDRYAEPLAGIYDGRYVKADDPRVVAWFIKNGYESVVLNGVDDKLSKVVYVNKNLSQKALAYYACGNTSGGVYEDDLMVSRLVHDNNGFFINEDALSYGCNKAKDLKETSLSVFNKLSLQSYKAKSRIWMFYTVNGVVGYYMQSVLKEQGSLVVEQGAFYIASNKEVKKIELGSSYPYRFDVLNLGDIDGDGKGNILIRRENGVGNEDLSFYEFENDSWVLEERIRNSFNQ